MVVTNAVGCTICGQDLSENLFEVQSHDILGVAVCELCIENGQGKELPKEERSELCSWCGDGGTLFCCDLKGCDRCFCTDCVGVNLGEDELEAVKKADVWECYVCNDAPLLHLQEALTKFVESKADLEDDEQERRTGKEDKEVDAQAKLDLLIEVESKLDKSVCSLEPEAIESLKVDIFHDINRHSPEATQDEIWEKVNSEIELYEQMWKARHERLQEQQATLVDEIQELAGLHEHAIYERITEHLDQRDEEIPIELAHAAEEANLKRHQREELEEKRKACYEEIELADKIVQTLKSGQEEKKSSPSPSEMDVSVRLLSHAISFARDHLLLADTKEAMEVALKELRVQLRNLQHLAGDIEQFLPERTRVLQAETPEEAVEMGLGLGAEIEELNDDSEVLQTLQKIKPLEFSMNQRKFKKALLTENSELTKTKFKINKVEEQEDRTIIKQEASEMKKNKRTKRARARQQLFVTLIKRKRRMKEKVTQKMKEVMAAASLAKLVTRKRQLPISNAPHLKQESRPQMEEDVIDLTQEEGSKIPSEASSMQYEAAQTKKNTKLCNHCMENEATLQTMVATEDCSGYDRLEVCIECDRVLMFQNRSTLSWSLNEAEKGEPKSDEGYSKRKCFKETGEPPPPKPLRSNDSENVCEKCQRQMATPWKIGEKDDVGDISYKLMCELCATVSESLGLLVSKTVLISPIKAVQKVTALPKSRDDERKNKAPPAKNRKNKVPSESNKDKDKSRRKRLKLSGASRSKYVDDSSDNDFLDDSDSDSDFVMDTKPKCESPLIGDSESSSCEADEKARERLGSDDSVFGENRGRRNIRHILNEEQLDKKTRNAVEQERMRKERLKQLSAIRSPAAKLRLPQDSPAIPDDDLEEEGEIMVLEEKSAEELVYVAPNMAKYLKDHQVEGIQFMYDNVIESLDQLKEGSEGYGCILAHVMGLGKTFQVVALVHTLFTNKTIEKHASLGGVRLKTALVIAPINVLQHWRNEFRKWDRRRAINVWVVENGQNLKHTFSRWQRLGGILIMGHSLFRSLVRGKAAKKRSKNVSDGMEIAESETASSMVEEQGERIVEQWVLDALQHPGPDLLICDEAHVIKNVKAQISTAMRGIRTKRRIALTGSPLQNNLSEYYVMVDFVRENYLGTPYEFKNRFENPINNGLHHDSSQYDVQVMKQRSHILYELLSGFVSRKDVRALEETLPRKYEFVVNIKMAKTQRRIITLFMREKRQNQMNILKLYQKLLVVWGHPAAVRLEDEEEDKQVKGDDFEENEEYLAKLREIIEKEPELEAVETGTKVAVLLELIAKAMTLGDKTLVFSQSLRVITFIESVLQRTDWALGLSVHPPKNYGFCKPFVKNRNYYRLDGSISGAERQQLFDRFNTSSSAHVFLISTRAGNMGANLVGANRVVIFDSSFNPANDLQAEFRCYRYGQKKEVFVYRLLAERTMEEKIYTRQVTKAGLSLRVVDDTQVARTFTRNEVDYLTAGMDVEDPDYDPRDDPTLSPRAKVALLQESQLQENLKSTQSMAVPGVGPNSQVPSLPDRSCAGILDQMHQRNKSTQADHNEEEVKDPVLRHILDSCKHYVANFHEHEKLLQDKPQEQLTEDEISNAWQQWQSETTRVKNQTFPQTKSYGQDETNPHLHQDQSYGQDQSYPHFHQLQTYSEDQSLPEVLSVSSSPLLDEPDAQEADVLVSNMHLLDELPNIV